MKANVQIHMRARVPILKMLVDETSLNHALGEIASWQDTSIGHYICVSNVHMCMETWDDRQFEQVINHADMVVPDGLPIYWGQRLLGHKSGEHIRGLDLTLKLCELANDQRIAVGFYGGTEETLDKLGSRLKAEFPELPIKLKVSPPFRPLTAEEKAADVAAINASGVEILFVGLGCPRQERWMAEHKDSLSCTMLGVGAAFDFVAGTKMQAPRFMQVMGMEWLFRLMCEPGRLWKRYLSTNTRFIWFFAGQLLGKKYVQTEKTQPEQAP